MEHQSSMWSGRGTTMMPYSSNLVHLTLPTLVPCIWKGCSPQLNGPGSWCDIHSVHWDHTILDKVVSEVLEQLARQYGLQSVLEAILCKSWGLGTIDIFPFLALVPDHYFNAGPVGLMCLRIECKIYSLGYGICWPWQLVDVRSWGCMVDFRITW